MRNSKRWLFVALLAMTPGAAWAGTAVGVDLGIANGPTTLRLSIQSQPEVVYVRESNVYVVDDARCDDDMFRYGGRWWVVRDDRWYRAASWRGPFVRVRDRAVPVALWRVPERHWKHHPHGMPPGLARKSSVVVVDGREPGRERGRGHGREHDRD